MPKIWEHEGFTIDEGLKPRDENFKPDFNQYFFIVKEGEQRKFKYCIWISQAILNQIPELATEAGSTGHKIPEYLYQRAVIRVKEKIDAHDFASCLLEYDEDGVREIALDDEDKKII